MRSVVSAKEMSKLEKIAIEDGYSGREFMLMAGKNIGVHISKLWPKKKVIFLVGKGNNGGDGYVAAIELLQRGFSVLVFHMITGKENSPLNKEFSLEFQKMGGKVEYVENIEHMQLPEKDVLLVDALLGTGFKGNLHEIYEQVINKANQSNLPIFSIDIPSGLDGTTGKVQSSAICALVTFSLGLLKQGFFLEEGMNHVGKIFLIDFGLPEKYVKKALPYAQYFQKEDVVLPFVERKRHKYSTGYVIGIGGSQRMQGAARLSALASLRAGAGIIRVYSMDQTLDTLGAADEIIYQNLHKDMEDFWEQIVKADSLFIGPGMGRDEKTAALFFKIMEKVQQPIVLDADALFHIAKQKDFSYPLQAIITPHRKEMLRLLDKEKIDESDFLNLCRQYAKEHKISLLLKGAPTVLFHLDELPLIISSGTPALAKAGTGDVLTGVIAALLAQKIPFHLAAAQGAYLHGRSAELVERKKTVYGLLASDVIEFLPEVFKEMVSSPLDDV